MDADTEFPVFSITPNYVRDLDFDADDEEGVDLSDEAYADIAEAASHSAKTWLSPKLTETVQDVIDQAILSQVRAYRTSPSPEQWRARAPWN